MPPARRREEGGPMSTAIIPRGYVPTLDLNETQEAIQTIKKLFQGNLSHALNLKRVSAPLRGQRIRPQ